MVSIIFTGTLTERAAIGYSPETPKENVAGSLPAFPTLTTRVIELTDAVLNHHIDPPTRQQMVLTGIKAVYAAAGTQTPDGMSRRISTLSSPEQFTAFLADIWPKKPVKSISAQRLEEVFLEGALECVTGSAQLISAKELKVQEQLQGNRYVGIHIQLSYEPKEKRSVIQALVKGGPADRAGAKKEDRIEQVDGVSTQGMTLAQVVDRIRGPERTEVVITVRQPRTKEARTLRIVRGTLFLPTVMGLRKRSSGDWEFDVGGPDKIAYLRVQDISASTPRELRMFAQQLETDGFRSLILDLRDVSQSALHPTVLLADCLLDHGQIGRVQMADRVMRYEATPDTLFRGWPIAVLVNRGTSCGAEWLAAALQDNHRATIVGGPTASVFSDTGPPYASSGTADVSTTIALGDGSWSVMLTTGRLERGDGRPLAQTTANRNKRTLPDRESWQSYYRDTKWGIKPDHLVGDVIKEPGAKGTHHQATAFENGEIRVDPQADTILQKAIQVLRDTSKKS
jgi:carboxyl-terminal processing protease